MEVYMKAGPAPPLPAKVTVVYQDSKLAHTRMAIEGMKLSAAMSVSSKLE